MQKHEFYTAMQHVYRSPGTHIETCELESDLFGPSTLIDSC